MGFLNRTGAEIGYYLDKICKKHFLQKIPKVPTSDLTFGTFESVTSRPGDPNLEPSGFWIELRNPVYNEYGILKFDSESALIRSADFLVKEKYFTGHEKHFTPHKPSCSLLADFSASRIFLEFFDRVPRKMLGVASFAWSGQNCRTMNGPLYSNYYTFAI